MSDHDERFGQEEVERRLRQSFALAPEPEGGEVFTAGVVRALQRRRRWQWLGIAALALCAVAGLGLLWVGLGTYVSALPAWLPRQLGPVLEGLTSLPGLLLAVAAISVLAWASRWRAER
ncbi:MAG: hypothetical protein RL026_979 [Pseudomonadota bacterium]|jgi:hypothetical protein